jgi:RNA processing factor Prp31
VLLLLLVLQIVPDNYLYARVALVVKDKGSLTDDSKKGELVEVLGDEGKAQEVMDAARHSMGQDISPIDLINIETFAKRVINLAEYRQKLHTYLLEKVGQGLWGRGRGGVLLGAGRFGRWGSWGLGGGQGQA